MLPASAPQAARFAPTRLGCRSHQTVSGMPAIDTHSREALPAQSIARQFECDTVVRAHLERYSKVARQL